MRRQLGWVVGVLLVIGMSGLVYAQFAKPEEAIEYRQATMFLIGTHFSRIGAVIQGKKPYDQKDVLHNAQLVATLIKLPWDAFLTPGTAEGNTKMKPAVLEDPKSFKAHAEAAEKATAKLVQVAQTGKLEEIKSQFGAVAKNCKNCHDQFRKS